MAFSVPRPAGPDNTNADDAWEGGFGTGGFNSGSGSPEGGAHRINDRVFTPTVFSVAVASDASSYVFLIGMPIASYLRSGVALFKVYFTPLALVTQMDLATPENQAAAFKLAKLVGSVPSPAYGGNATFTSSLFFGQDGWFWATASSTYAREGEPTAPFRAPVTQDIVNLNYPPEVSGQAISKVTKTMSGLTVSELTASAVVPSDSQGVLAIFVTAGGTGYTSPPDVVLTGGLTSTGVAATATAMLNPAGEVSQILLGSTGSGYVAAPVVTFTGGAGAGAAATAVIGASTQFDGIQLYLTNYLGGSQVEGPYLTAGSLLPGQTARGKFVMIPDAAHVTTFAFVSVSRSGRRSTAASPTATLTV